MAVMDTGGFLEECDTLNAVLEPLDEAQLRTVTQFKGWTFQDLLVHLHFWNRMADHSVADPDGFEALAEELAPALKSEGFRKVENKRVSERGTELRAAWIAFARDMAGRWSLIDPKTRLPWIGPSMSARSAITARQMETWAHGFEIFDALGLKRNETDRIRNIVVLGINTFGWAHKVHGLDVPGTMPEVRLTAPSGEVWTWGDVSAGRIEGPAVDFAAVVTQTRAFADTDLVAEGAVAWTWMGHAQCFAGGPERPPAPGSRRRRVIDRGA